MGQIYWKKIPWVRKEECCCLDKHPWNKGTDKHLTWQFTYTKIDLTCMFSSTENKTKSNNLFFLLMIALQNFTLVGGMLYISIPTTNRSKVGNYMKNTSNIELNLIYGTYIYSTTVNSSIYITWEWRGGRWNIGMCYFIVYFISLSRLFLES